MSKGSFNPKNRFLGQKVRPVASEHTDRQAHTHTHTHTKVTTVGILSGFQVFFLELSSRIGPIMTCRQNMIMNTTIMVFFVFFKCPPRVILVYSFGGRGGGAYKYNLTPFWVPSSFLTNDPHVILSTGSQCHFNKSKVH